MEEQRAILVCIACEHEDWLIVVDKYLIVGDLHSAAVVLNKIITECQDCSHTCGRDEHDNAEDLGV
jgi:hypothetical protein